MEVIRNGISTEISNPLPKIHKDLAGNVILNFKDLLVLTEKLRSEGKKICITQGTYDMFHVGHGRYLMETKKRGDILIVGVDDDAYTKGRKGEHRPIWPEDERLETLLHLRWVDYVFLQRSKDDAVRMIREVKPDIFVTSESTKGVEFTERVKAAHKDYCGEVVVLQPQATTSTSNVIRKLLLSGMADFQKHIHKLIDTARNSFSMILSGVEKEVDTFVDHKNKEE